MSAGSSRPVPTRSSRPRGQRGGSGGNDAAPAPSVEIVNPRGSSRTPCSPSANRSADQGRPPHDDTFVCNEAARTSLPAEIDDRAGRCSQDVPISIEHANQVERPSRGLYTQTKTGRCARALKFDFNGACVGEPGTGPHRARYGFASEDRDRSQLEIVSIERPSKLAFDLSALRSVGRTAVGFAKKACRRSNMVRLEVAKQHRHNAFWRT